MARERSGEATNPAPPTFPRAPQAEGGAGFEALEVDQTGYSRQVFSSWHEAGWRSLLVRRFDDAPEVEDVMIPPSDAQQVVLVTSGRTEIESWVDGRWRSAGYLPGSIGMTAPGRPTRLRWRSTSPEPIGRLHVHLPGSTLRRAAAEMGGGELPEADALVVTDPLLEQVMLGLADAAATGAPDLYAESAAEFLAVHLLVRHTGRFLRPVPRQEDARVRRALQFMQENLHQPLSLADISRAAGLSSFHFLRVFKAATGRTPHRHLTKLRVAAARRHLERGDLPVSDIAHLCGFSNPAHLSSAFAREMTISPSAYRRERRS
ncbi:helix-turn-helix domain-containing protein [Pseudonocardia xinjiangensis]|uniref:helix-turn-helix domain-containing protein n=1 Tax=Pseudonocardia xinjiangensis TaxID=75289 RepID=UPI003D90FD23